MHRNAVFTAYLEKIVGKIQALIVFSIGIISISLAVLYSLNLSGIGPEPVLKGWLGGLVSPFLTLIGYAMVDFGQSHLRSALPGR